eukprot:gnl/TRDRNA2_/TRDRNA2_193608_c0_seq1.p2 gnl/TRDRNA2_/TRDRNA2_193608_c0~~gnl/TRDRNA2_/TRDRNA2_193608_c0_seq1.p2  ORF type:complete len:122 (+),score=28.17 gnl/TRDRNA2_/TRDRNA2_193608_c0_seq1:130-495(+)
MLRRSVAAALRGSAAANAEVVPYRPWRVASIRCFGDRRGVVKFFNPERGFGFISSDDQDFFVHYTGIEADGPGFRSLADEEEVEFDIETDDHGKQRAVRVTGIGGAPVKGTQRERRNFGAE